MKPAGYPLPKLRTLFVTKFLPLEEACRLRQGGKGARALVCAKHKVRCFQTTFERALEENLRSLEVVFRVVTIIFKKK